MKLIVFADIHGNLEALEKMLQETEDIEDKEYVFCGDIFGYFYKQEETINILRNMPNLIAVKGNHDMYYLQSRSDLAEIQRLYLKYGISYKQSLKLEAKQWLEKRPLEASLQRDGWRFHVLHGSPDDFLEGRIYPDFGGAVIDKTNPDVLICAHTHYRFMKQFGNILLVNPGSLGQPRDGNGYSYAIIDTENKSVIFKSVVINESKLIQQVKSMETAERNKDYLLKRLSEH